eukprot:5801617-Alexandrium_andersonii.AAC.1
MVRTVTQWRQNGPAPSSQRISHSMCANCAARSSAAGELSARIAAGLMEYRAWRRSAWPQTCVQCVGPYSLIDMQQ